MSEQVSTEDPKTSVVVSRVIAQPIAKVWAVLMTKDGSEALLGRGAVLGEKDRRGRRPMGAPASSAASIVANRSASGGERARSFRRRWST